MKGPTGEKGYFAAKFFPICARLMWGVTDSVDWVLATTTEEEEDEDNEEMQDSDMGETALDRMCQVRLRLRVKFRIRVGVWVRVRVRVFN
jgi:hypothetical protein